MNPLRATPDPWLAEALGRPTFRVSVDPAWVADSGAATPADLGLSALAEPRAFGYIKVPAADPTSPRVSLLLGRAGFALVDTNVVLDAHTVAPAPRAVGTVVRRALPSDREGVVGMARRSFQYSRFHLDPGFTSAEADHVKGRWTESAFNGQRGDGILVAEVEGVPAGFLLFLLSTEGTATIDLIAVDPSFRRRGLASALIEALALVSPRPARIRVGTQIANVPSVRCYEALGFRLESASYVFHFHGA